MTDDRARASRFIGRFLGSWELALGELVIVSLGVLVALWADQAKFQVVFTAQAPREEPCG